MSMPATVPSSASSATKVVEDSTKPLYFWNKCMQLRTNEHSKSVIAYRGDCAFRWKDEATLAHMDNGLLRIPDKVDDAGAPIKTPWAQVQLRQLVLLKSAGRWEAMWRRVLGNNNAAAALAPAFYAPDDMYGVRKLRLPALKAILGGLDKTSADPAMVARLKFLFEDLSADSAALWWEFIDYAQSKSFASELSVNLSEQMEKEPRPFDKRIDAEPEYEREKKPRQDFDSEITPIARPKRSKAEEDEVTDDTLMPVPPHLYPIRNGGAHQMTCVYGLPPSSTVFQTDGQVMITAPTAQLKRRREGDEVPEAEKLPRKELRSLYDRLTVQEIPGGKTVFSFSAFKVEKDTSTNDHSFLVFHGAAPTRFVGQNPLTETPLLEFEPEDVDGSVV